LYIDSRVGGSKRFQPPLSAKIITSKGGSPPQRNATYTLEVGISGEGRPTAVGKEKTEISSVSETLPGDLAQPTPQGTPIAVPRVVQLSRRHSPRRAERLDRSILKISRRFPIFVAYATKSVECDSGSQFA
jgi:hypothetical protein